MSDDPTPDDPPPAKPPRKPRGARTRPAPTSAPRGPREVSEPTPRHTFVRGALAPILQDPHERERFGLEKDPEKPARYLVELNVDYQDGLQVAQERFVALYAQVVGARAVKGPAKGSAKRAAKRAANDAPALPSPLLISKTYFQCQMSAAAAKALVQADEGTDARTDGGARTPAKPRRERLIYRVWPDFPVRPLIDHSVATIKADAAYRAFAADGAGITWAVIDSGVHGGHVHFRAFHTLDHPDVDTLHRDFTTTKVKPERDAALVDGYGHGTHVAGIIAGGCPADAADAVDGTPAVRVFEQVFEVGLDGEHVSNTLRERTLESPAALRGIAPRCKIVSLKVVNDDGQGHASDIIRALAYIREELNGDPKKLRVHGVNLSVGYEFDALLFACGQSPLCVEVDRLVKTGVVVVAAAGNTGYGQLTADERMTKSALSNTINDPGNADLAITVGATHRDAPHMYGVSYFSSKGPTVDGRLKPDLVAPGERITSAASPWHLAKLGGPTPNGPPNGSPGDAPDDAPGGAPCASYVDDSGTSMAAPHVSGAIAAFLSIRQEYVARPEAVKRVFCESGTSLGRERYFEGHGLLDLMRAIQSV